MTRNSLHRNCSAVAVAWAVFAGSVQAQSNPAAYAVAPQMNPAEVAAIEARRRGLFARMAADPSNLDVAFEYAALSAQVGDLEGAISTLERMLIFAPGLPRLQLELGVLYYRLGAFDTAQLYFDAALAAPNVPNEVRQRVNSYLASVRENQAGDDFSGAVLAGVRWQSNANAAPEGRTITLNGTDFLLDESATGDPDVNGFTAANLRFSHDLENQGDRLETNLLTYGAVYAEHNEINTGLAELTFGPRFNLERFDFQNASLATYGILTGVLLEDDPYLGSVGAGANLQKGLGQNTHWKTTGEYRREEFANSDTRPRASDRSGDRARGSTGLYHQLSSRFAIFGLLDGERRWAERDYLSLWELGAAVGGTWTFAAPFRVTAVPWSLGLSLGYEHREYDVPDPIINSIVEQKDDEAFVQGTLSVPIHERWSVQAQAGYRDVSSNYDLRDFENYHGSLAVLKAF